MDNIELFDRKTLTTLLDLVGIAEVMECLTLYCYSQAINQRARYPNSQLVRDWERAARVLERARQQIEGLEL